MTRPKRLPRKHSRADTPSSPASSEPEPKTSPTQDPEIPAELSGPSEATPDLIPSPPPIQDQEGQASDMVTANERWSPPPSTARVRNQQGTAYPDGRPAQLPLSIGAIELEKIVKSHFPEQIRQTWIRGRTRTGPHQRDVHEEGRAIDFMVTGPGRRWAEEKALGTAIADFLVTNAEDYGIQLIVWNHTLWVSSAIRDPRSSEYTGTSPHTDHVHAEVSPDGARLAAPGYHRGKSGPIAAAVGSVMLTLGTLAALGSR